MARSYFKLLLSTWDPTSDFPDLSTGAQWLYWVLGSHPLLSPAGVLPIQERKWARRATDATLQTVEDALQELVGKGLILVDHDTEEALIRTFIRHDGGARNTNIGKAIAAAITRIESDRLRAVAQFEFDAAVMGVSPHVADPDEDPPEASSEGSDSGSGKTLREQTRTPTPPPTPTPSTSNIPPEPPTREMPKSVDTRTEPTPIAHSITEAIAERGRR